MADVRIGQTWRTEDGYLYKIVSTSTPSEMPEWVYARHPNGGSLYQVRREWFDQPGWHLVRDTQASAAAL